MSTICPILWKFQSIRNNGDFRVCCQANVTPDKGVIRKEDGTTYNAKSDNINDVRNTPMMNEMRLQQINGEWPVECGRCKLEEETGLPSRRLKELKKYDFSDEQAIELTNLDGSIDVNTSPVVGYDLRFGNKCNLKCMMCGPTDSDSWYEDHYELMSDSFSDTCGTIKLIATDKKVIADTDVFDWHNSEYFWETLEQNIAHIGHVYLCGGEPLMIRRHYDFLQKCVDFDVAKNITIEYNTNLTILPQKVLDLWSHFKEVQIGASIDGIDDVIEYQRYPLDWEKTKENLFRVNAGPDNFKPWLATTITVFNVFHIPELIKWKLTSGLDKFNSKTHNKLLNIHTAHHPQRVNIKILPDDIKRQVEDRYNEFYTWFDENPEYEPYRKHAENILNPIVKFMNTGTVDQEELKWLKHVVHNLDKKRGKNIYDIVPEYKGWL